MTCETGPQPVQQSGLAGLVVVIPMLLSIGVVLSLNSLLRHATPSSAAQIADIEHAGQMRLLIASILFLSISPLVIWAAVLLRRVKQPGGLPAQEAGSKSKGRFLHRGAWLVMSIALAAASLMGTFSVSSILKWFKPIGDSQIVDHAFSQLLLTWKTMGLLAWFVILIVVIVQEVRGRRTHLGDSASLPG